jgi:hypothetical protein
MIWSSWDFGLAAPPNACGIEACAARWDFKQAWEARAPKPGARVSDLEGRLAAGRLALRERPVLRERVARLGAEDLRRPQIALVTGTLCLPGQAAMQVEEMADRSAAGGLAELGWQIHLGYPL